MAGRPTKTLSQRVAEREFTARRHRGLLDGRLVSDPDLAALQSRYQEAETLPLKRRLAREFEAAVLNLPDSSLLDRVKTMSPQEFFRGYLRHPKGFGVGSQFVVEPFQDAPLTEMYRRDGNGDRIFKTILFLVARGNGKSPLAAGLGLYEMLRQPDRPDVYCLAGSKLQASICLDYARGFVSLSPSLAELVRVQRDVLLCDETGGKMEVRSAEGLTAHGLSPSVSIIDELHVLSDSQKELWVAMQTASHKRADGYVLGISTMPASRRSLLGGMLEELEERLEFEQVHDCLRVGRDAGAGILLWQCGAGETADVEDHAVWRRCNPASWISDKDLRRLRGAPGVSTADFCRLHLNQLNAEAEDQLVSAEAWEACRDTLEPPERAPIHVGVESGHGSTTCAVTWLWRASDRRVVIRSRIFATAAEKTAADERSPSWRRLVDLEPVGRLLVELNERYDVRRVCLDPNEVRLDPDALAGVTIEELRSGSPEQKENSRKLFALIESGEVAHDGGDVLKDHVLGTRGVWDTHGRLAVYRRRQERRVDGWYATVNALTSMPENESVYATRGAMMIDAGPEPLPLAERDVTSFFDPGITMLPSVREDGHGESVGRFRPLVGGDD